MDWSNSLALDISDSGDLLTVYYGEEENSPRQLMITNIYSEEKTIICEMEFPWQASYGLINDDWIVYRVTSSYDIYGSDYRYIPMTVIAVRPVCYQRLRLVKVESL